MSAKIIQFPVVQPEPPAVPDQYEVKVGSIFVNSWGYDQTNVDYYVVVAVTPSGKSVKLRQIGTRAVAEQGPHDRVVADPDAITGECGSCGSHIRLAYSFEEEEGVVHLNGQKACRDDLGAGPLGIAEPRIYTKRLKTSYRGVPMVHWNSFSNAYLWDGKPEYQTGQGYGH